MATSVTPELLAPEERKTRIEELHGRIARQWVRYGIVEGVIGLALIVGIALWSTETISDTTGLVLFAVGSVLVTAHIAWTLLRMRPWREELRRLEQLEP
jgi:tellurite resistance protein TehA-like permease